MLPALMAGAGLLGRIFGGAGQNMASGRLAENNQRLDQARLTSAENLARANMMNSDNLNRAGLDMSRKTFLQNEPSVQAGQALRGNLMERIQPLRMTGLSDRVQARMPQMNSIIDAIGPEARQSGKLLAQRGLTGLQNPTQFDPLPAQSLPPATMAALKQSGLLEKIMGSLGLGGSLMGGLGELGVFGKPGAGGIGPQPHDVDADPRYPAG